MRRFGLIGKSLVHSFSASYFSQKFKEEQIDASYELLPMPDVTGLVATIVERRLEGLNVTIPYKQDVLPLLSAIDAEAELIGAVNVLKVKWGSDGMPLLKGYNTDAIGFRESLKPLLKPWHTQALVLGTGGASKAVVEVLRGLGIVVQLVSRTRSESAITYEDLDEERMQESLLIVNTTPLGTYPDVNASAPIPYALLTPKHLLYDLVYNPAQTRFMEQGAAQGAVVKNGYEMLQLQAEASWTIWNAPDW